MDLTSYIANMSMYMAQSSAVSQASTTMLSKAIEQTEIDGQNAVDLIQSASIPPAGVTGHVMDLRA